MSASISCKLYDELRPLIQKGAVETVDKINYHYDLIGVRFPMGINRIKWSAVPQHRRCKIPDNGDCAIIKTHIEGFIHECLDNLAITEEKLELLWLGDQTDFGVKMNYPVLLEISALLFSYPQHSYIVPEDVSWCLNYTFENEMFFGKAVQKRRKQRFDRT